MAENDSSEIKVDAPKDKSSASLGKSVHAPDTMRVTLALIGLGILSIVLGFFANYLFGVQIDPHTKVTTDTFDVLDQTALSVGVFLVLSFMYLFTGEIGKSKMTAMVMFCYLFTILAIAGSIVPFMFEKQFWESTEDRFKHTPIGILRGCILEPPNTQLPDEITCVSGERRHNQWVVNVGGNVIHQTGTASLPSGVVGGQSTEPAGQQPVRIEAGLVVPLYVMVLALMGGAVSMTRRVPEYQRRVWLWYLLDECQEKSSQALTQTQADGDDDNSPTLAPAHAREYLVFQLMQVMSAPLIAFTAYYLFSPGTPTASVVLGFASGFASETILIAIRGAAHKLKPAVDGKPSAPGAGKA